jgi:hypothetical protein
VSTLTASYPQHNIDGQLYGERVRCSLAGHNAQHTITRRQLYDCISQLRGEQLV